MVVPVSALAAWHGCDGDDYDRACAVDGLAGVIAVGEDGAQALVLADDPASTCHLPEHSAFLRWIAADSETGLRAAAEAVLADPDTAWEECGTWVTDGPAILMDSGEPGTGPLAGTPVPLGGGRLRVRAVYVEAEENWVGLVQLLPAG